MVFVDLKISIWCIFLSFLGVQISSRMIENCHEFYYLGHYRSRSQPMFTSNTPCLFPLRSLILQSFLPSHASIHLTATFRRSRRLGAKCPCKLKSLIISGEEREERSLNGTNHNGCKIEPTAGGRGKVRTKFGGQDNLFLAFVLTSVLLDYTELCKIILAWFQESLKMFRCPATHPKIALWRNISDSRSQNLTWLFSTTVYPTSSALDCLTDSIEPFKQWVLASQTQLPALALSSFICWRISHSHLTKQSDWLTLGKQTSKQPSSNPCVQRGDWRLSVGCPTSWLRARVHPTFPQPLNIMPVV